jgi:hypothetical protein
MLGHFLGRYAFPGRYWSPSVEFIASILLTLGAYRLMRLFVTFSRSLRLFFLVFHILFDKLTSIWRLMDRKWRRRGVSPICCYPQRRCIALPFKFRLRNLSADFRLLWHLRAHLQTWHKCLGSCADSPLAIIGDEVIFVNRIVARIGDHWLSLLKLVILHTVQHNFNFFQGGHFWRPINFINLLWYENLLPVSLESALSASSQLLSVFEHTVFPWNRQWWLYLVSASFRTYESWGLSMYL